MYAERSNSQSQESISHTCQIAKQTRKISGKQNFGRVKDDERSRACLEEHSETAGLFLLALLFVL